MEEMMQKGGAHGGGVVEHMALRTLNVAEVWRELLRRHDHLAQQQHGGAGDLAQEAHHPHDAVHLREVAAVGAASRSWC